MNTTRLPIAPRSGGELPGSDGPAAGSSDAASTSWMGALGRWIPALGSLQGYGLSSLNADLVAGITVAAVALPQAMAYAILAGLPAVAIAEAKTALAGTDIAAIKAAMEKLGVESQALGEAIYAAAQAEQAAGGAQGGAGGDDVVDAEVVEDDQEKK